MKTPLAKIVAVAIAGILALGAFDAIAAPSKKQRVKRAPVTAPIVVRDYDGTPIIMKGYTRARDIPDIMREEKPRPAPRVPRGSSTYVPPPVPSPHSPNSPPSSILLQPPSALIVPPPINTYSDRVRNCIHSAPLNTGVGNNPADRNAYIAQCAN